MDYPQRWAHKTTLQVRVAENPVQARTLAGLGFVPDWHRRSPLGFQYCDAGFRAFFGGAWDGLCDQPGIHIIGSEAKVLAPLLCDEHFNQVNKAGLVTEPFIDREQFDRRYGGPDS